MKLNLSNNDDISVVLAQLRRYDFGSQDDIDAINAELAIINTEITTINSTIAAIPRYVSGINTWAIVITVGAQSDVQMNIVGNTVTGNSIPVISPGTLKITHLSCVIDSGATFNNGIDFKIFKNGSDTGAGGRLTLASSTNHASIALATPISLAANDTFDMRVFQSGVAVSHTLWGFVWGYITI